MESFGKAAAHYKEMYADDGLENYESGKNEKQIAEHYVFVEQKFETLAQEMHLPFLDRKLFRKYFISQKSALNLSNLSHVVFLLQQHKARTLDLLRMIFEREQILSALRAMASEFSKGKMSTLEAQTKVLQLLYSHQQATLRIVEGIQSWRSKLTRPYPFEWRGVNYIFKIIKDCHFIDQSELKSVLPLNLSTFPLCSNLSSLCMFGPKYVSGEQNGAGSAIAITYPMKMDKKRSIPQLTAEMQQRLVDGEGVIAVEHESQLALMKELIEINANGAFITVLDVRPIVPNCAEGIRLNNKAWDKRLQSALTASFKKLAPKSDQQQQAQSAKSSDEMKKTNESADAALSAVLKENDPSWNESTTEASKSQLDQST